MNTIQTSQEFITETNIPVFIAYPKNADKAPLVLLNHGTGGDYFVMKEMAERLAKNGCFAISVDGVWHGKRWDEKLDIMRNSGNYKQMYLDMLLLMAADISKIIDNYIGDSRVDTTRVGITGISQGGYQSFMCITKDERITVAAPMIGSPDLTDEYGQSPAWETIDPEVQDYVLTHSPLLHYEKMAHVKLLVQNGDADTIVPVTGTRRLDEKLRPLYADRPEDYRYIEFPGLGHATPDEMQENVIEWLTEKLKA